MQQHIEKLEDLPESIKLCFSKMKETTRNLNYEVGAFIAFYDNSSPEIVFFTSENETSISESVAKTALHAILANHNEEQLYRIVFVHTHPVREGNFPSPSHSTGDLYGHKMLKDFIQGTLKREIKLESVVLPTYSEFNEDYVFGQLVVTNKDPEGRVAIKAEVFPVKK